MKRSGYLWEQITDFSNLYLAAKAAQKAKRYRENVLAFNYNLESNLLQLQMELLQRTYRPGAFRSFVIHDPKRRIISAAPYRDRIVHHAICQVIEPIFESTFIFDSYANRKGKGTHRALIRFVGFCRRYKYVFQADIQKYFPSIDHEILKTELRRKIKCKETLWLLDTIIDHSNPQEEAPTIFPGDDLFALLRRHGIPIGNLTSQHFANIYLNRFDHFVKEQLGCMAYVRYVDDFALFSDSREELQEWRIQAEHRLESLRVRIHPVKSQITATSHGTCFVGFRVLGDRVRVLNRSLKKARERFRRLQDDYANREVDLDFVRASIGSWLSHISHANSMRLQEKVLSALVFRRQT